MYERISGGKRDDRRGMLEGRETVIVLEGRKRKGRERGPRSPRSKRGQSALKTVQTDYVRQRGTKNLRSLQKFHKNQRTESKNMYSTYSSVVPNPFIESQHPFVYQPTPLSHREKKSNVSI